MKMTGKSYKLCIGSFDLIKGFAICVVIFGHIAKLFDVTKLTWFYPVLVILKYLKTPIIPLFFVISGYGFTVNSSGSVFRKTAKNLLVPYAIAMVCFCVLQPLFAVLQNGDWHAAVIKGVSIALAFLLGLPIPGKLVLGIRLSHCAIVWFLLALFWAQNILAWILKTGRTAIQCVLVLLCAAAGYWLFQVNFIYYCLPHGLIATGYVYLGHALKKYRVIQKFINIRWHYSTWIPVGIMMVIIAERYAVWGEFDLCYGKFTCFPVDYIGVAYLAVLLLGIGIYFDRFDWRGLDILRGIGIYSYWVFCIHSVEQKCLPWDKFIQQTAEFPNVGFTFALVIKCIIITMFCRFVKKFAKMKYRKIKRL